MLASDGVERFACLHGVVASGSAYWLGRGLGLGGRAGSRDFQDLPNFEEIGIRDPVFLHQLTRSSAVLAGN